MSGPLYIRAEAILAPEPLPQTQATVLVKDGRVAAVGPAGQAPGPEGVRLLAADGLLLAPGFIDLQINGGFGVDFTEQPGAIWDVGARLPRYGVTAFLPTIISSPLTRIREAQEVLLKGPPAGYRGAVPMGLHLEGPFLNPQERGAHNPTHMRLPSLADIEGWSPERGVRLVTLAPELPGALDIARALTERGVLVSAGHSAATWEEASAGIDAGIRYGTHLFNAMPPLGHREPALPGALLLNDHITVGIIADGEHLHPSVVSLVWRLKGPLGANLVTDATAGLGMPPGTYRLGDNQVTVDGHTARLRDGTLAGSILSLDQAVRNTVLFTGCSPSEAIACVTRVPAELLKAGHMRGRISAGLRADMVLLTTDLHVSATIVGGDVVYERTTALRAEEHGGEAWR